MNTPLLPILWFLAILCLIPLVLWLLKRTPLGASNASGVMRVVAQLSIAPNQRLLTVEVGQGEEKRWLVLGVTGQQISTLHVMPPQPEAQLSKDGPAFAQMLSARMSGKSIDTASVQSQTGDHRAS
ncbi:flagellar biosynthetic protein FliO [Paucibacter sp. B2R-40]|uniref:flagellar biosynthetic protein FliO n=1 Tax=Paucibacter sp. B2R-40 TaxID=2893554 RepID=UPI0021E40B47|nr:flagellar biosynthetic protein FliO [Paucibacter sp. B2R-40]MCV2355029.1 flagellar biosynthetic protein FliO [Paucibacter sp. B2R-40]